MANFNLFVKSNALRDTMAAEIAPINKPGSPNSGGADAWNALREIGDFFSSAAGGAWNLNVQYTDGLTSATATVTWSGNVSNSDTLTIGGQAITFVTGTPSGSQVKIGGTQAITMANLVTFINLGGNALALAGYCTAAVTSTSVVTLTSVYPGPVGNLITLAKSAANLAVSAATFGSGGAAVAGAIAASSSAPAFISAGY